MYSSTEFAEATEWLKREVDRLGVRITNEKRARLEEIFEVSSRYEWAFWEMCWHGERWLP